MDIKIVEFVNKYLGNNKVKGVEIQVDKCPFCGKEKKKFFINTEKGVYQCFSGSCRETGHISSLYKKFGEEFNLEIKGSAPIKDLNKYIKPTNENIINFFKTRGISKETLKKNFFDVMSTETGDVSFVYRKNFDIHSVKVRSIKEKRFSGKKIKDLCLWKLDFADTENPLIITEGEMDALSFDEQGINNAVSVPTGAGAFSWIDTDYEELEKFKCIILAFDNDEAGKNAVEKIIKRMPEEAEIKIVDFSPYKDANEALLAGENLKKFLDSAQLVEDESIIKFENIDIDTPVKRMSTGSLYLNRAIGGIRPGELNIFTGQGGSGKSTALNQIMLNIINSGTKCLIYTPELTDVQYKKWTCRQLFTNPKEESTSYFDDIMQKTYYLPKSDVSKKMSKWVDKNLTYISSQNNLTEKEVLKTIIKNIRKKDVKFIVLDNLMKISFDTKTMEDLYEKQKLFIEDLSKICKKYDVSINLVAHPKKHETSEPDQYVIMGTSNIPNLVDNIYYYKRITEHSLKTVFKDQKEYIQQKEFSSAFMVLKSREGEKIGEWLFLNFDPIIKHFYYCDEGKRLIDDWKDEELKQIIKLEDIPDF